MYIPPVVEQSNGVLACLIYIAASMMDNSRASDGFETEGTTCRWTYELPMPVILGDLIHHS